MVIAREMKRRREQHMMIEEEERREWSDIPVDVLVEIVGHLLFLDHLSFRCVCKAWRSASLQSPPQNHPKSQPHWLMSFSKKSSTWEFGDPSTGRLYSLDLPELTGIGKTKCFLSTHGWLLLSHITQSSIFFFNPFSRARIDLPWSKAVTDRVFYYPKRKPVFAVSAPPTSPDCTFYPIKSAVFSAGILYWVDKRGIIWALNAEKGAWKGLQRPREFSKLDRFRRFYSYMMELDGQVMLCLCFPKSGRRHHVVLESPFGNRSRAKMTVLEREDKRYLVEHYGTGTGTHVPRWLRPDTFSVGAWCVSCDSEDEHGRKLFSSHLRISLFIIQNFMCLMIQLNSGKVVAVGPGARDRDGKLIAVSVKEGDTVLLPEYGGTEVKLADKE
ncbi:hypothetical protein HHK36_019688 [Tetracentron sinense]|uniref:F-box domain-containing protein n=1 Tax=Tetracentron sinense TaxID=13715 RepID=A0A834Z2M6_TETSI|nr:hypothetical protein HHK36_019688 [Tetracentron sinense]